MPFWLRNARHGQSDWPNLYVRPALDKPPEVIIQAIVIDAYRGKGIGKILMSAAESWASERGYNFTRSMRPSPTN
jgi:GNAT superfamily N-acetyltransferase